MPSLPVSRLKHGIGSHLEHRVSRPRVAPRATDQTVARLKGSSVTRTIRWVTATKPMIVAAPMSERFFAKARIDARALDAEEHEDRHEHGGATLF